VPPAPEAVPLPISVTTPATAEPLPTGFSETVAAAKVSAAAATKGTFRTVLISCSRFQRLSCSDEVIDVRLDIL
jgi:hypothetical protein